MFGKKTDEACAARVKESGFTISKELNIWWPHIYVDDGTQKWAIVRDKKSAPVFYSFSDVNDYEIRENGNSIAQGRAGSAVAGGLLFGVAGAVIGASRSKKVESTCSSMQFIIHVNDISSPTILINLLSVETPKSSQTYQWRVKSAQEFAGTFDYMMKKASESKEPAAKSPDASDEIKKLADLHAQGILTDEEFSAKKKQLLGI